MIYPASLARLSPSRLYSRRFKNRTVRPHTLVSGACLKSDSTLLSIMNISKRLGLLSLGLVALGSLLVSCSESVDLALQRRERNEKAFAAYGSDASYRRITMPGLVGKDAYVFIRTTTPPTDANSPTPRMSDYVRFRYRVSTLIEWQADSKHFIEERGFDQDKPDATRVSGTISGVATALQHMRVGETASVIIPWYLAYGDIGSRSIPGYSALYFELNLAEILGDSNQ